MLNQLYRIESESQIVSRTLHNLHVIYVSLFFSYCVGCKMTTDIHQKIILFISPENRESTANFMSVLADTQ